MVVLRLLTALQRSVCLARDSGRVRVTQRLQVCRCQPFNRKSCLDEGDSTESAKKPPRPKTVPVPKITLLLPDNSMTVTVLAEAERLAKRRKLSLIKVENFNSKTQRSLYKLVNTSALIEETAEAVEAENLEDSEKSRKKKEKFKETKIFQISARSAEHDVRVKAKHIVKLLSKWHQVKIIINLDDTVESKALDIIKETVRDKGRVQQMPGKKNFVQLLISPLDKNEDS